MLFEFTIASGLAYLTNAFMNKEDKPLQKSLKVRLQKTYYWLKTGDTSKQKTLPVNPELTTLKRHTHHIFMISASSLALSSIAFFGFPLLAWLSLPGLLYIFYPLGKESYFKLKQKKIDTTSLASVVIGGSILMGYFFVGSFAAFMILLSKKMVFAVQDSVQHDFIDIFSQHPDMVWVKHGDVEVSTPFSEIKKGDIVVVHAGSMIPVDGKVTAGIAMVDQHVLTGESQPVEKEKEDTVFASTVVISGEIFIEVREAGDKTTIASIGQMLNETTDFKNGVQLRSEDLANKTVVPTLLLGAATYPFLGPNAALGIVNAHYKARMGVFAPMSTLNYFKIASQHGVLFKDGRSLDLLHNIDTIVFDKTGTLTQEIPELGEIYALTSYSQQDILGYAAAAENKQNHPIAKAIVAVAKQQGIPIADIDDTEYKIGYGLNVLIKNKQIRVGSYRYMELEGLSIPKAIDQYQKQCQDQAYTFILVAVDNEIVGGLELIPSLRPETKAVIKKLRQLKQIKALYIISGDHETPTRRLAEELGIDHYFAQTLPQDKARLIDELQNSGKAVCYIGDGINDAIALKKAQISVSLRGASTVAQDTAQIILMDGSLSQLNYLFRISKDFRHNMNFMFISTNLVPMFIGMGGIYMFHLGLMSTVIINKIGTLGGMGVAMLPTLKDKYNEKK